MGTAAAIFNHAMTAGQALRGTAASPMAGSSNGTGEANRTNATSGTSSSDDTSSGSATISANDFLTLLVTEMQNQDPTADTDPNEYINQLVQVNSLEQLININQTLSGALGSTTPSSGDGSSVHATAAPSGTAARSPQAATSHTAHAGRVAATASSTHVAHTAQSAASSRAPGNLGVPAVNASAQQVGHALDGRVHLKPSKGSAIALQ
jgi:flagellar basal-body rod modification protein FlgD